MVYISFMTRNKEIFDAVDLKLATWSAAWTSRRETKRVARAARANGVDVETQLAMEAVMAMEANVIAIDDVQTEVAEEEELTSEFLEAQRKARLGRRFRIVVHTGACVCRSLLCGPHSVGGGRGEGRDPTVHCACWCSQGALLLMCRVVGPVSHGGSVPSISWFTTQGSACLVASTSCGDSDRVSSCAAAQVPCCRARCDAVPQHVSGHGCGCGYVRCCT